MYQSLVEGRDVTMSLLVNKGDNGILDLSQSHRLRPGTGGLDHPCILHAPGSLCTYEPQWGSDVFGMYQSLVEGREVPWSLLVNKGDNGILDLSQAYRIKHGTGWLIHPCILHAPG